MHDPRFQERERELTDNIAILEQIEREVSAVMKNGGAMTLTGIIQSLEDLHPSTSLQGSIQSFGALFGKVNELRSRYGDATDLTSLNRVVQAYIFGPDAYRHMEMTTTIGGEPRYDFQMGAHRVSLYDSLTAIRNYSDRIFKDRKVPRYVGRGTIANSILQSLLVEGKKPPQQLTK